MHQPIRTSRDDVRSRNRFAALNPVAAAVAAALVAAYGPGVRSAYAGPTGEQVVGGSATVQRPNAQTTLINQASQRAAIDWNGFSINVGEAVIFRQPDVTSVALNRVVGPNPSQIFGSLQANGQVFLINPSGILFGRGASVDVGGLVASTLNISNNDFMAGRNVFNGALGNITVEKGVNIRASERGYVALLGNQVSNSGTLTAANGTVALAAGRDMVLDFNGDGLLSVKVNAAAVGAKIAHDGIIVADGGRVIMTAAAKNALLDTVLNVDGLVQARGAVERNGSIYLEGGDSGVTRVAGTLDVSNAQGKGGEVRVLGEYVGLFDHATIDASGTTGGGTVLVGGDYQGKNPDIRNAFRSFVDRNAVINADATVNGDGGKVVVWADDVTRYYGTISARGGERGGDGGFAELSGKGVLDYRGRTDLRAPQGRTGTLLLDPADLSVVHGAADAGFPPVSAGTFESDVTHATITDGTINQELATSHVIVQTGAGAGNGDITFEGGAPILFDAGGNSNNLTFRAHRNITVNQSTSYTNGGTLALRAGNFGGAGDIAINNDLSSTSGLQLVTGSPGAITRSAGTVTAGVLSMLAANGVGSTAAPIVTEATQLFANTGSGDIAISEQTGVTLFGLSDSGASGSIAVTANGLLQTTQPVTNSGSGGITLTADDMSIAAAISAPGQTVTLRPLTAGRPIDIGTASAGTLGLTNAQINQVTAGTLVVGRNDAGNAAGAITVSSALAPANATNLSLVTGSSIDVNAAITTSGGAVTLNAGTTVALDGAITTTPAAGSGGAGGAVVLKSGGAITTTSNGTITTTGSVSASGGSDSGGAGGEVLLYSTGGAITLQAGIVASGGASAESGDVGGNGGVVTLRADNGNITAHNITTDGGAPGAAGGTGGTIQLRTGTTGNTIGQQSGTALLSRGGGAGASGGPLKVSAAGAVTLTNASNDVNAVAASVTAGGAAFSYVDAIAVNIGGTVQSAGTGDANIGSVSGITTNGGAVTVTATTGLLGIGTITTTPTTATNTAGGAVFLTGGSVGVLGSGLITTTGSPSAGGNALFDTAGAGGEVLLRSTAGAVTMLSGAAIVATGGASAESGDTAGAGGVVTLRAAGGGITVGNITTDGGATDAASAGGTIQLITESAGSAITQRAGAALRARGQFFGGTVADGSLKVSAAGPVTLTQANNTMGTLAANVTGAGAAFSYSNATALTIGTVGAAGTGNASAGSVSGITTSGGAVTVANAGGDLTVSSPIVTTPAAGSGSAGGSVALTSATGISVNSSITTTGATGNPGGAGGDVLLRTTGSGSIVTSDTITASGGAGASSGNAGGSGGVVTLLAEGGAMSAGSIVSRGGAGNGAANGADGAIQLSAPASFILQSGTLQAGGLKVVAGANSVAFLLNANDVATVAGSAGTFAFTDANAVSIGTVGEITSLGQTLGARSGIAGTVFITAGTSLAIDQPIVTTRTAANTAGGTVTLTAGTAITSSATGTITTTGSVSASGGTNTAGAGGEVLLHSTGGAITLNAAIVASGGASVEAADTGGAGGVVTLRADNGNITAHNITADGGAPGGGTAGAGGTIQLRTGTSGNSVGQQPGTALLARGGVVGTNDGSLKVSAAGAVTLTNAGNNVGTLAANVTAAQAAFSYSDATALTIGTVGSAGTGNANIGSVSGITTLGGAVTISDGPLTVSSPILTTPAAGSGLAGGSVSLTSTTGLTVDSGATITTTGATGGPGGAGGAVLLRAGTTGTGNITTSDAITASGGAGAASGDAGGNGGVVTLLTGNGTINAGSIVTRGGAGNGAGAAGSDGTIQLSASSAIAQSSTLQAGSLKVVAGGNVTLTNANDVTTLAGVTTGAGSSFSYTDANSVAVGTVGSITSLGQTLGARSGLTTNGGAVNATATSGRLTVESGNITAGSGSVALFADDMAFNGTITGNGGVTLAPSSNSFAINIGGPTVPGGGGALGLTDAMLAQVRTTGVLTIGTAGTGTITFNAPITGTPATWNSVSLVTGGQIVDNFANNAGSPYDVKATTLALTASGGIGVGNAIDTQVSNLSFTNTGAGGVAISNTGALTINAPSDAGSGTLTLTVGSPLTIAANIIQAGDISLTAGETNGAGDDLTVNAGVTVRSTGGDVTLQAGDNVVLTSGALVQAQAATKTVTITAGAGDVDGIGAITGTGTAAGSNVVLDALQGVGTSAARVTTQAANLAARATASGGVFISNSNGANPLSLQTNGVANSTAGGAYDVTSSGPLSVGGPITTRGGNVALNAASLTINDAITTTPTAGTGLKGGDVTLTAPGAITSAVAGTITTTGATGATGTKGTDESGGTPAAEGGPGGTGGAGGAVVVRSTGNGSITLAGAITAQGAAGGAGGTGGAMVLGTDEDGNPILGNASSGAPGAGGAGGSVTVRVDGSGTMSLGAAIDTTGGPATGIAVAGAGGAITLQGPVVLNANPVTLTSAGGAASADEGSVDGPGANIRFTSTLNGQTAFANGGTIDAGTGNVIFEGVTGGIVPLGALTVVKATNIGGDAAATTAAPAITAKSVAFTALGNVRLSDITTNAEPEAAPGNVQITATGGIEVTGKITTAAPHVFALAVAPGSVTFGTSGPLGVGEIDTSGNGADSIPGGSAAGNIDFGSPTSITLRGNITAKGGDGSLGFGTAGSGANLTFGAPVVLAANVTIDTRAGGNAANPGTDGTVTFPNTVNSLTAGSARSLTVTTAGTTTFGGSVGATTPLASLTTNGGGTTAFNNGGTPSTGAVTSVTTTGAQTYDDALTLGANTTMTSTGGGAIAFGSTVQSGFDVGAGQNALATLAVNTSGTTTFNADINVSGSELGGLSTGAGGTTVFAGAGARTITINGPQTYNDAVVLNNDTLFQGCNCTPASITFGGNVNANSGATNRVLTVSARGNVTFSGSVGNVTPLAALSATTNGVAGAAIVFNSAAAQTIDASLAGGGGITLAGPVSLASGSNVTINAGAELLQFTSTIDGGGALGTLGGLTVFPAPIGNTTALASLDTSGPINLNAGTVRTTGSQMYRGVVTLGPAGNATTLTSTAAGNITFNSTVDGDGINPQALTISTTGATTFNDTVGAGNRLSTLTVSGGGAIAINDVASSGVSIGTTGAQTYGGPVTLSGNVFLVSDSSGAISFSSTVDSTAAVPASPLTVSTAGQITFGGAVGGIRPLDALTTNGGGAIAVNGGGVATNNAQTYDRTVTIGGAAASPVEFRGGSLAFNSMLQAGNDPATAHPLTLTTDGLTFGGAVAGRSTLLIQPTADNVPMGVAGGAGTLTLPTGTLNQLQDGFSSITLGRPASTAPTTVDFVVFQDPVTIRGGSVVVEGGGILGSGDASITITPTSFGPIALNANLGTDSQPITLNGPVTLGANIVQVVNTNSSSTVGANVTFASTVRADNSSTQNRALLVTAGQGIATFSGDIGVGANAALARLDVNAASIALNGSAINVNDANAPAQTSAFRGPVVLGSDLTISTNRPSGTDSNLTFFSTINGTRALTVDAGNATVTFTGQVGNTAPLTKLDVTGATINVGASMFLDGGTTAQANRFNGTVRLTGNAVTIDTDRAGSADSDVTFTGAVAADVGASNNRSLTVIADQGTITFGGNIGAVGTGAPNDALSGLQLSASTIALNGALTNANGGTSGGNTVSFAGAVALGSDVTVNTDRARGTDNNVLFTGTLDSGGSARQLFITAGGGTATLNANIGTVAPLRTLDVTASSIVLGAPTINVSGGVGGEINRFNGPVTLGADVAINNNRAAGGGTVTFASSVDSGSTPRKLSITGSNSSSTVNLGNVGANAPLTDLDVTASTINLNGATVNVTGGTTAQTVTFNGAVNLGANVTVNTDRTGVNDSNVTFGSSIGSDAPGTPRALAVTAGNGTATFSGNIGSGTGVQPLADFDVTSNSIVFNSTAGAQPVFISSAAPTIVQLNGPVTVATNSLQLSTGGANVEFNGTAVADTTAGATRGLSVNAGTGTITFAGDIGNRSGGALSTASASGGTINFNGNNIFLDRNTAGGVNTFSGALVLGALTGTPVLITSYKATAADGSLSFTSISGATHPLTLSAGTSSINVSGATNVAALDASAGTAINLGPVTSGGAVTLTSDSMALNGISAAGQSVALRNFSAGRAILLGADSSTDLALNVAEINGITADRLVIGNASAGLAAGAITIANDIAPNVSTLRLFTGGGVTGTAGGIVMPSGALAINAGGTVNITDPQNDVATLASSQTGGSFTFNDASALTIGVVDSTVTGVTTANAPVTITPAGNLALTNAVNAGTGNATLTSVSGAISGSALVTGNNVTLDSATGVGTGTSGRMNTTATSLAARSRTSGGVFVNETDGVLLQAIGAVQNFAAGSQGYDLVAGGAISGVGTVTTGNANTAGTPGTNATSGGITLLANGAISTDALTTGNATAAGAAAARSGSISVTATGGTLLAGQMTTGAATMQGGSGTANAGDIALRAGQIGSSGNSQFVALGTASGGSTNTQGVLDATTTGTSSGANPQGGSLFVVSTTALPVRNLTTAPGNPQSVRLEARGGDLTLLASGVDSGVAGSGTGLTGDSVQLITSSTATPPANDVVMARNFEAGVLNITSSRAVNLNNVNVTTSNVNGTFASGVQSGGTSFVSSGSITVTAASGVSGGATIASGALTVDAAGGSVDARAGDVTINAGTGGHVRVGLVRSGNATMTNAGADDTVLSGGNITLTGRGIGTSAARQTVQIGTTSGAPAAISSDGLLRLTSSGAESLGDIFVTSTTPATFLAATAAGSRQTLDVRATGGALTWFGSTGGVAGDGTAFNGDAVVLTTTGAGNDIALRAALTAGDVTLNAAGGVNLGVRSISTSTVDTSANPATNSRSGDIAVTAGAAGVTGSGSISTGNSLANGSAATAFTATSGSVTITTPGLIETGPISTGNATIVSGSGNDSATSGAIQLNAQRVGTSAALRQGVNSGVASGGINNAQGQLAATLNGTTAADGLFLSTTTGLRLGAVNVTGSGAPIDVAAAGGAVTLAGNLTTNNGAVFLAPPVNLGNDVVVTANGGVVTFSGRIESPLTPRSLTVTTSGLTTFGRAVGGNGNPLSSFTVNGGGTTAINGGVVTTTGAQTYSDNVTLGANTTLTGTTPTFGGTVTGAGNDLTLNFSGTTAIDGATFTGIRNLATGNGGTTNLTGALTTTGTQTYNDNVALTGHTTLTGTTPTFAGTVTGGGNDLTLNFSGTTAIDGGTFTGIRALTTGNGGTTSLTGALTTTGAQTYNDNVTLAGTTTLNSGATTVTFAGTVEAPGTARSLTVTTSGLTTFTGAVGGNGNPLASLTVNGGGVTALNGGAVTTTGAQTYNDSVTLGANTTLTGTAGTFAGVAGNGFDLTLNYSDDTTLSSAPAGIRNLATGNGGRTLLSGVITTTGTQTYGDATVLTADTTLNSGLNAISFGSTVDGASALSTSGPTTFGGTVGATNALASLSTSGAVAINGAGVRTTGNQAYAGNVTLGADAVLNAGAGNITFAGTLESPATARALSVTAASTRFVAAVGGNGNPLGSLAVSGAARIDGGAVITTGAQTYSGNLTLGANTTLTGTTPTFVGTVTGGGNDLTLNFSGTTSIDGAAFTSVRNLATGNGGTTNLTGTLTTTGTQTFNDNVVLAGNTTLTGTAPTFGGTVTGAGNDLTLNFSGTTSIDGAAFTGIRNLATGNGGTTNLTGALTTTGAQTFNDNVVLAGNTTLTGTTPTFVGTVTGGGNDLTLNFSGTTGIDGATFTGIRNLATGNGGRTLVSGTIATTGTQSYADDVVLTAGTTFAAGANAIAFSSTVNGAFALNSSTTGATTFGGAVGATNALATLSTAGAVAINGAGVRTTGNQAYGGNATLGADAVLSAAAGSITFAGTLESPATPRALTITSGNVLQFNGAVGGNGNPLGSLSATASSTRINGGAVTTTGTQTYNNPVVIGANTNLNATAGNMTFAGTLDADAAANNRTLLVNAPTGTVTFSGSIGASAAFADFDVISGPNTIVFNGSSLQTVNVTAGPGGNTVTFTGNVRLDQNLTVNTGGGANNSVAFNNGIDGGATGRSLGINAGSGDVRFQSIGNATPLALLNVNGSTIAFNARAVGEQIAVSASQVLVDPATGLIQALLPFSGFGGPAALTFTSTSPGGGIFGTRTTPLAVDVPGLLVVTPNASRDLSTVWLTGDASRKPIYEFYGDPTRREVVYLGRPAFPILEFEDLRRDHGRLVTVDDDAVDNAIAGAKQPIVCQAPPNQSASLACEAPQRPQ